MKTHRPSKARLAARQRELVDHDPSGPSRAEPVVEQLEAHRAALVEKSAEVAAELRDWRTEQGGFTSMSRVAHAARELLGGEQRLRRFARQAGEAEATGESPLRTRLRTVQERIDLTDQAIARATRGAPPLRDRELGVDLILDEIALALDRPLSREDLIAHRAAFLEQTIEQGRPTEALETYASLAALYLQAEPVSGEGAHSVAGRPSLTSVVNGWILTGRLRTRGSLVLTGDDLEQLRGKVLKTARRIEREEGRPAPGPEISAESIAGEVKRLRALEAAPRHRALLEAGVTRGHQAIKESVRGQRLSRFGRGVVRLLDDPATWAMVIAGGLAGGLGRVLLPAVGSRAVEAGAVEVAR